MDFTAHKTRVRAELADRNGMRFAGRESRLRWKGHEDLSMTNQPIMLRFRVEQAKLFSIEFGD